MMEPPPLRRIAGIATLVPRKAPLACTAVLCVMSKPLLVILPYSKLKNILRCHLMRLRGWMADETTSHNAGDFDGLIRLGWRCVGDRWRQLIKIW